MRYGSGPDVASGSLFLRPVRMPVRRRRLPREGRQTLLQSRLPGHVRPQVQGLQHGHH